MRKCAFAIALLLASEMGGEEVGLSTGPADPGDIGTRCSVMAGRTDRAYLNCAGHEQPALKTHDPALSEGPAPRFRGTITDGQPGRRYRVPGQ